MQILPPTTRLLLWGSCLAIFGALPARAQTNAPRYEAENLTISSASQEVDVVTDPNYSNGEADILRAVQVGDSIEYETPTISAGTYLVVVGTKLLNTRGQYQLSASRADEQTWGNLGGVIDQYSSSTSGVFATQTVATWSPASTNAKLMKFTVTGKNASSSQYWLCIDYIELIPFGPNVYVFDPTMSMSSIQSTISNIFSQQSGNQFGSSRYAYLFQPGAYDLNIDVGFYTQVLGLGQTPDAVSITGRIESDGFLPNENATCNFTRSAENVALTPTTGSVSNTMTWAVSQGCDLRLMHVKGNLNLSNTQSGAYSSGGFLADSKIDDTVNSITQQQWFSRNDTWGSWSGGVWNMVFAGVTSPPGGGFPSYTVVANTPVIREKPILSVDSSGAYVVVVPNLGTNTNGTTWANGPTPGTAIPVDQFYFAQAGVDTAATINAALSSGQNLIFTPGIYNLSSSILVTRANTVILGLGLPSLVPENGVITMQISDVDGVSVAGLIFEAGTTSSPTLLQVGPSGSSVDHAANPTILYDIVARVGGEFSGTTASCVTINSHDVIGDNFWLWRADHGNGVGWTSNACNNGLIVNGNNVIMYGLAVEHHEQYQTLWNGNGGRTYFYQSEMPYDAPSQSAWQEAQGVNGYASYKLGSSVTSHAAYGLGIYGVFISTSASAYNAIEAPSASGISLNHMIDVWITGESGTQITHILNGTGGAVDSSNSEATLTSGN